MMFFSLALLFFSHAPQRTLTRSTAPAAELWINDLVKHSAVGLKEFQRQVGSQRKEIDGIELSNSVLAKTLSHLASGHDRDTLGTVEVLAGCPKVSEDNFLDYILN